MLYLSHCFLLGCAELQMHMQRPTCPSRQEVRLTSLIRYGYGYGYVSMLRDVNKATSQTSWFSRLVPFAYGRPSDPISVSTILKTRSSLISA